LGIVSDVSKILEKTSIYFQPSKIESHGISVIDAMSFSIPCITSRAGGLPESVINNKTGYTIDLSLEQSVEKIEKLMFDKNLSEKFGKEAKKVVDEKFSYNKWRADILNALRLNDEQ
jgi:glycosyltransferase involved in cell wall biosynthesis